MTTDEIMELVDAFGVSCAHTSDGKFSANRDAQVFRANIANAVRKLANAPEAPAPAPNALEAEHLWGCRANAFGACTCGAAEKQARAKVDALDAERWRTFVGLPHEIRAEWAANLSAVPVLNHWIDQASKDAAQSARGVREK